MKSSISIKHENCEGSISSTLRTRKLRRPSRMLARNWKHQHKWAIEKPKVDNVRRSRGIYFIDPEDKQFKEIIRNARRKLETPMAPAMPCKTCKKNNHAETRSKTNDFKSKFACILEASESRRMRMEESLPNYHEDHIAGRGDNSLQHYNLVHKFIPMPQAMKIPAGLQTSIVYLAEIETERRRSSQKSTMGTEFFFFFFFMVELARFLVDSLFL